MYRLLGGSGYAQYGAWACTAEFHWPCGLLWLVAFPGNYHSVTGGFIFTLVVLFS